MRAALILALALLALPAHAHDWTDSEKRWAAAWIATRAVDWAQTRHVARNPDRFREINPFFGRHPSLGEVNRNFVLTTAAGLLAAHYLPQYRKTMLQVWFAVGVGVTARNAAIGIRMEF